MFDRLVTMVTTGSDARRASDPGNLRYIGNHPKSVNCHFKMTFQNLSVYEFMG